MIADRWGVTREEVERRYPCDEIVPTPAIQAWRGITVRTGSEQVWPWVAQLRLGPYSYDWIDNLGRRSPRELRGLPDPVVGEPFMSVVGGRPLGRIESVVLGEHMTGTIAGSVMSYVLVPIDERRTRLLMKIVVARGRVFAPLLTVGDLIMARRQLLNLAALAESTAAK